MAYERERHLAAEKEALLVSCTSEEWIHGRVLTRVWTKIRDREMEGVVDFLDHFTSAKNTSDTYFVVNPEASDEEFDGEWALQSNTVTKADREEEAAPSGVTQILREVFTVADIDDLMALNARRIREEAIEGLFDFVPNPQDGLVLEIPYLRPSRDIETACMETITEEELVAAFDIGGYEFAGRRWAEKQQDHTASLFLTFKATEWQDWDPSGTHASPHLESSTRIDNHGSQRTRTWFGINKDYADQVLIDLETDDAAVGAPEGWHVVSVQISNNRNGSVSAQQVIQEAEIEEDELVEDNIIRPHDFQPGDMDRKRVQIMHYDEDELAAYAPSTPAGMVLASDTTSMDAETGQYSRLIVYELITWQVWGHDAYEYDTIQYRNAGLENNKERTIKTWFGIRIADMQTAVDDLRAGNRVSSGNSIRDITINNNGDGSITVVASEGKLEFGDDRFLSKQILRPWGWVHCRGEIYRATLRFTGYDDLFEAQQAAKLSLRDPEADLTIEGKVFQFIGYVEDDGPEGRYSVVYTYEYVKWDNDSETPTFKHTQSSVEDEELGHVRSYQACAVGRDNVDVAFGNIELTDHPEESRKFVLGSKSISPQANGEFVLRFSETTASEETTAESAEITRFTVVYGFLSSSYTGQRVWFRRTREAKETLVENEAVANFEIGGITFFNAGYYIADHHDGTYTVTQTGNATLSPTLFYNTLEDDDWVLLKRHKTSMRTANSLYEENPFAFKLVIVSEWVKRFDTPEEADAAAFSFADPNDETVKYPGPIYRSELPITPIYSFATNETPSFVRYGGGAYEAHRILMDIQSDED